MAHDRLLTTREVSLILGISDKEVIDLSSSGALPHFKVAGEFLRFRSEDILKVRKSNKRKPSFPAPVPRGQARRIRDFFYFNDFYIICSAIIIFFLWIIIKDLHT